MILPIHFNHVILLGKNLIYSPFIFLKRISISTSYWPTIWPAPEPFTLTIITGENTFIEFPQYNQKTSSCLSPSVFPINSISDKNKFLKSSNIQSHFSENINYFEIPETSSPLELISLRDKVYSKKIEINPETGIINKI